MPHSITHSRRRILITTLAAAALLAAAVLTAGALGAQSAQASTALRNTAAARHAAKLARRCERRKHAGHDCGKSARLQRRRAKRHHRLARRKDASPVEVLTTAAEATAAPASPPPGAAGEPCANAELRPTESNLAEVREATLCLINEQREQHGELALVENNKLTGTAQGHSEDMVARNYFEHTTPTGEDFQTRITASGYMPHGDAYEIGENIDTATLSLSTPAAAVNAWMNSPDHRANILNGEFRETGVGIAAAAPAYFAEGEAGATYTQDFGVLAS